MLIKMNYAPHFLVGLMKDFLIGLKIMFHVILLLIAD